MAQFAGHVTRSAWFRVYRGRMNSGLEHCRHCGTTQTLTFDHIIPVVLNGGSSFNNVTILCLKCNTEKGDRQWPHLRSLAEEEDSADPTRRWSAIAQEISKTFYNGPRSEKAINVDDARARLRARFNS